MDEETRKCNKCQQDFVLEKDDFSFYKKMGVPAPKICPDCRFKMRAVWRNERTLYNRTCDLCNRSIISMYNPKSPYIVYCNECWVSDKWDPFSYAINYDSDKPFFEQLKELIIKVPKSATYSSAATGPNINSEYANFAGGNRDGYLIFNSGPNNENCAYSRGIIDSRDVYDVYYGNTIENTYESVNIHKSNGIIWGRNVSDCIDSRFILNCSGCQNCFGCVNLRNQKYCIFNKQYTKEEYKKEIEKWDLGNYEIVQKAKEKFWEFCSKIPRRFALIINSKNITGDDIKNTKNCQNCFSTLMGVENCKYVLLCGLLLKDSYDVTLGGGSSELYYENSGGMGSQRCFFGRAPYNSRDIEYSEKIYNCSDCFGCTKLENKKYCILNKQYPKEEYEKLISKIKKHMNDMPYIDKKGRTYRYGEYFPSKFSLWAYNETWAQKYFPLTREEALEKGFNWYDEEERDYKITIKAQNLPDNIVDVPDSILEEIIECEHKGTCNEQCTTAFRILPNELQFYRQMNLALPHLCPSCRYGQRIKKKNPPKLWHRKCMCNGVESEGGIYKNTIKHFHEDSPCQNEFETAIGPDRKEIVYCEKCYQAEFI